MKKRIRRWIGSVLWYFIEPFVDPLFRGLVDEDELESRLADVRQDIQAVEIEIDDLRCDIDQL